MSKFLDKIIERAKTDKQKIVLPEGSDIRTVQAAREIMDAGIADVIILGSESEVTAHGIDVSDAIIIDPRTSELLEPYAQKFAELRKKKGVTINEAREQMKDESYFGVMMVYMDDADGMVSGACHSTADTLRPALQILKTAPDTELVSSFFVEDVPDCLYGDDGLFVFADCALNIYPTAEELAEIAIASANSFEQLCGGEPHVAMLSYSSYGSGKGESAEKMAEAIKTAFTEPRVSNSMASCRSMPPSSIRLRLSRHLTPRSQVRQTSSSSPTSMRAISPTSSCSASPRPMPSVPSCRVWPSRSMTFLVAARPRISLALSR